MVYDVIVVGAGVEGTSTAYHLARDGQNVALIEQFPWPHTRGSSHGHTRQMRKNYSPGMKHYSDLANRSRSRWRDLERETGIEIYREIGVISFALEAARMERAEQTLRENNMPFTPISIDEVYRKYPMFKFPRTARASLEKEAGILLADNALKAFMTLFKRYGGELRDREEVLDITPGNVISVQTSKAVHQTRKLVITAGPWAPKILSGLGLQLQLQPIRVAVMFWKEKTKGLFSSENIPSFRFIDAADGGLMFAIPSTEYPGLVKISVHDGPKADPDRRDITEPPTKVIKMVSDFVHKYLPGLEDQPSLVEYCMYTLTPDEEFILDRHPKWNNITIGAGFSGHGFKMAPLVGEMLSDMAQNKPPKFDMEPYKIQNQAKVKTTSNL